MLVRGMKINSFKNLPLGSNLIGVWLILFTWVVLVAWRPLVLGFYHDDWASIALPIETGKNLSSSISGDPTRPLYVLIIYFLRWMFSGNPLGIQWISAILSLLCGLGIALLVTALFGQQKNDDYSLSTINFSGVQSAILWFSFPWSLGFSAWPIMLPPLFGMTCTIYSCLLLAKKSLTIQCIALSLILMVMPWFIYEATWFLWMPVILILFGKNIQQRYSSKKLFYIALFLLALQVIFILINRYGFSHGQAKQLSTNFLQALSQNYFSIENSLAPMIGKYGWPALKSGIIAFWVLFVLSLMYTREKILHLVAGILICLGIVGSQLLYALAGYGLVWDGLFSRVTLPLSFWLVLLFGYVSSQIYSKLGIVRTILIPAFFLILIPLSFSLVEQTVLWKKSWEDQVRILKEIPSSILSLPSNGGILLLDLPSGTPPVYSFGAYWDINGAVVYRIYKYFPINFSHIYATVARIGEFKTTWDGQYLRQYWCRDPDSELWRLEAREMFYWKLGDEEATRIKPGYEGGC